ncbi:MAG: HAD family hydrolase [Promethearchaeota archaeon]
MISENELIKRLQTEDIRVIIFDFDGTILEIKEPLRKAIEYVFENYNIKVNVESAMEEIIALLETIQGYPLPKIILESHQLFRYISSLKGFRYLKKLRIGAKIFAKYLEYSESAKIKKDAVEFIKKLSNSCSLFIISHNKTDSILNHLKKEGLDPYFKGIYGSDKLPALKPNPDVFLPIFELFPDLLSSDCIMIGDMPSDIEAAKEAGFWTIGVSNGISKIDVIRDYKPDLIINSYKELIEKLEYINETKISKEVKIKS